MTSRISAPFRAFFDAGLYREVAREWTGTGLAYLFLLLGALGLIVALRVGLGVAHAGGDPTFLEFVEAIPPIRIEHGVVSADVEQPYRVVDPDDPGTVIVVDTTGEVTEIPSEATRGMLLTRDKLIYKKNRVETQEFDLSTIDSFEVDSARVVGWLGPAAWIAGLCTAIFLPLAAFVYRAGVALALGGLGSALAGTLGASIGWPAVYRLACVAMSPSILIGTALWLFARGTASGCGWWFLWGAVNLGYMIFALRANRAPA